MSDILQQKDSIEVKKDLNDEMVPLETGSVIENLDDEIKEEIEENTPEGFMYKLNSFVERKVKGFKKFLFSPIGKIIILFIVTIFFILPLILVALGFDNHIFRSSLEGTVFSLDNERVKGAEIQIQGKTVKADDKGDFILDDLDYGKWEIQIKADGYNIYKEQIVLNRFSNRSEFELVPLDFGVSKGAFVVKDFKKENISLKINDKDLEVNDDGSFETGRLIVGKYKLKFESPFYLDFEKEIEIVNGANFLDPITLEPAGDIVIELKDFVSAQVVEEANLKIENNDNDFAKEDKKFKIKNIKSPSTIKIKITKDQYKEKIFETPVVQGTENNHIVEIVREEKIVFYQNGNLIWGDIDGQNQLSLTSGLTGCKFIEMNSVTQIKFSCGGSIFEANPQNGTFREILSNVRILDGVIPNGIINVDNSSLEKMKLSGSDSEEKVLFSNSDENIISWKYSSSDQKIYFSTDSAVYSVNPLDDMPQAKVITTGIFYIQDIDVANQNILTLNYTSSSLSESNIWFIKLDGSRSRITVVAEGFSEVQFIDGNNIIYKKSTTSGIGLFTKNISTTNETRLVENIDKYILNRSTNLITSGIGPIVYVSDYSGRTKKL